MSAASVAPGLWIPRIYTRSSAGWDLNHWGPGFDWRTLRDAFRNRQVAVKSALLDQRILAGVGNIYADEALFSARIHPEAPVDRISPGKLRALAQGIVDTLESGIANHGTSFSTFETTRGAAGANQAHLRVFRRTGQPCPVCARPIRRIVVAQRSTHYCSNCQRRPRAHGEPALTPPRGLA